MDTTRYYLLPLFLIASLAVAAPVGGKTVCLGHYALCSHAACTDQPDANARVRCDCIPPGPNLNVGDSSCRDRDEPEQPRATFSMYDLAKIRDKPAMKAFHCSGKNKARHARCMDAKCTVAADSANDRKPKPAQCDCALSKKPADFYVLTDNCNQSAETLCGPTRSGLSKAELEGGHKQLAKFYGTPAALEYCPEAR